MPLNKPSNLEEKLSSDSLPPQNITLEIQELFYEAQKLSSQSRSPKYPSLGELDRLDYKPKYQAKYRRSFLRKI